MLQFVIAALVLGGAEARAEIDSSLEVEYSNAVLAYNSKDFGKALGILKSLLAKKPGLPEFLELEALSFRGGGQDAKAMEVYQSLLETRKATSSPQEVAPYQFELGALHFKANDLDKAARELEASLEGGFNPGASHFYLGLIAAKQKAWQAVQSHLEAFRNAPVSELRPAASLHLAQAYSESGYGLGATQAYFDARLAALEASPDPSAASVLNAANQGLAPVAGARFFGDVGLLFGYDSNPLTLPASSSTGVSQQIGGGTVNGAGQASGQSSAEATLMAGLGYMTSALDSIQLVPVYRLRLNYGERAAVAGNFAYNTLTLYLNHHPLDRFSYGLKLEGSYIFQDQIDDPATDARSFHPFALNGVFGPYVRWQFHPYWSAYAEAFFQPQVNYTDQQLTNSPALYQSGQDYHVKAGAKRTGGSRFFNPGIYVVNDFNNTSGTQFRSETLGLSVDDDIALAQKLNMILGADFAAPIYASAVPSRVDKTLSAYASAAWGVWRRLTLLFTASYTSNVSNSPANAAQYGFNRGVASGGASWAIF